MSASSSAASSSLSRPKGAVLIVAALVCAYGTYYLWNSVQDDADAIPDSNNSLHRSNAIHGRRPRTNTGNSDRRRESVAGDVAVEGEEAENNTLIARALTDGETIIDDDYNWNNPQPYERNGQNIVQLLFRVSEDATRRNAYVHRGCECNGCGAVPIRGIRYHCANCADYDLCEGCEAQGVHTKTHIFYKIRVPAPTFGAIFSMPVAYSGDPDALDHDHRILSKELTVRLSRETGFERPELDAYWEQWTFMANTEWREDPDELCLAMDRKTFEHCLVPSGGHRQPAPSLIFDRMFAFYDINHDDLISFPEFLHGIAYRKKKDKWGKIFQGYDVDGDGYVDRKDFLRMFRSYYALYRQLHRDMLGGVQEQQMITSHAHQLVTGRQPLSSAFAPDSRHPRGVEIRAGEGKSVQANGELDIDDGRGITSESGNDRGSREDILRRSNAPSGFWNRDRSATAYWETLLNPPRTMDELERRVPRLNPGDFVREFNSMAEETTDFDASTDDYDSSTDSISDPENDHTWIPNDVDVTDEDAEAVDGPGTRLIDVRRSSRRAVISHALARDRTEKELHDRWKRRQFYTDEEEGGVPPSGWKDEDDILGPSANTGESSKSQSRPSLHSRSSSKVRFAEDMDDFDTRSNPSTSSRSVPERWGGFEIPDAERDAGKEILFQVTQQAYNELLDPLFKDLEDAAVNAAERKEDLEKYRASFTTPEFVVWAEDQKLVEVIAPSQEVVDPATTDDRPVWPTLNVVDVPDLRRQTVEQLLDATGYTITISPNGNSPSTQGGSSPNVDAAVAAGGILRTADVEIHSSEAPVPLIEDDSTPEEITTPPLLDSVSTPDTGSVEATVSQEPTSPQSSPDPFLVPLPPSTTSEDQNLENAINESALPPPIGSPYAFEEPSPISEPSSNEKGPTKAFLLKLYRIDQEVKEAERRGGWGKLNFEEFEKRVKKFAKDGKGNQMDYLGSWIEFCIP